MTAQEIRTEIDKKTSQLFPKATGVMRDTIISAMIQGALIVLEEERKIFAEASEAMLEEK